MLAGAALGALVLLPALFAAFISAGAGHGDYMAARALFPYSMLLTLVEGSIGPVALAVGLAQFPVYGGVIAWCGEGKRMRAAGLVAALHVLAGLACFSGILPNFS